MVKTNKILDKLSKNEGEDKVKTSLYLSRNLYRKFKKTCSDRNISASKVLEELIRDFLTSLK